MIDALRWIVTIEVISLAFLPLGVWAMRALPDRGYVFARMLGLLLITFLTWLIGSYVPVAGSPILPLIILAIFAAGGWLLWGGQTVAAIRDVWRVAVVEEALFVAALVVWTLLRVRAFGPAINHTEQMQDLAFLNASYHAASYPPYDPWMSGLNINYYYLGYVLLAILCKLSLTAPAVGFNLANSSLFAMVVAGAYSLGYAMSRRLVWSLISPLLLAVIGNWHAALWGTFHTSCVKPGTSLFWGTFWQSTRVIGGNFNLANWNNCIAGTQPPPTITEYPLFSFILGDLHPHVMALPFTLLVIALSAGVLFDRDRSLLERSASSAGRLLLIAIAVGSLFAMNSWDFPMYFVVAAACILVAAYLADDRAIWWRPSIGGVAVLGILSIVAILPFYLRLHSLTHGIARVTTPSDLFEFLQVFGLFLAAASLLVFSLGSLLQPAPEEEEEQEPAMAAEAGQSRAGTGVDFLIWGVALAVTVILIVVLHQSVLVLLLALLVGALSVLHRALNTDEPNRGDALALVLVAAGCVAIALPEVVYVRDSFDGGFMYRMNTVFKFYYQGWTLLGLAAAYGVYRSWSILRTYFSQIYAWLALGVLVAGTLAAGIYTVWAPSVTVVAGVQSLDGSAWISQSYPGDYQAIQWLKSHVSGRPVVLEAVDPKGGDYSYAARISTFTALPTVIGWVGHEQQWGRSGLAVQSRQKDVATIYSSGDVGTTKRLLHQYGVRYVVVGSLEQQFYGSSGQLGKFGHFMRTVYRGSGIVIYTW